jgi:glycosyltransferase involved in cell wall biosynthesis
MPPEVSVVMSVYNGERYLQEAVRSILDQSFTDFEFIIVNDGSTDHTVSILTSFDDNRIRLVHNPENLGLTISLNRGIALAQGEFIARMDADDISLPPRLETQIRYLRSHPDVGVVGTGKQEIDQDGCYLGKVWIPPTSSGYMGWRLIWGNPIVHSSVMIRKGCLVSVGLYDIGKRTAQDYDLWIRLSAITRISNMKQVLILYRRHPESITDTLIHEQLGISNQIRQQAINRLIGVIPTVEELIALGRYDVKSKNIANSTLRLLLQIYKTYSKVYALTLEERLRIRQNVGIKIYKIASASGCGKQIWYYFLWAFWLYPVCILFSLKVTLHRLYTHFTEAF